MADTGVLRAERAGFASVVAMVERCCRGEGDERATGRARILSGGGGGEGKAGHERYF